MSAHILDRLDALIAARLAGEGERSYVQSLAAKGLPKVRGKVQEEAGEVLEASVQLEHGAAPEALAGEAADLIFHLMVLLRAQGLDAAAVWAVLEGRFGQSGLDEKASRTQGTGK